MLNAFSAHGVRCSLFAIKGARKRDALMNTPDMVTGDDSLSEYVNVYLVLQIEIQGRL